MFIAAPGMTSNTSEYNLKKSQGDTIPGITQDYWKMTTFTKTLQTKQYEHKHQDKAAEESHTATFNHILHHLKVMVCWL